MTRRHSVRAFTLTELLVVIGIVLLLAGLVVPALGRTKKSSERSKCVAQLRQLGIAMASYADDHAESLPAAHNVVTWTSTNPVAWTRELFVYFQTTELLSCPVFRRIHNQSSFNYFMGARAAFIEAGGQAAGVQMSRIQFPSEYILSGDANFPFRQEDADPDNYTQDTLFATNSPAHCGRLNVLFADSHVKGYKRFEPASMTYAYAERGVDWNPP